MFGADYIWYMVISSIATVIILVALGFVKKETKKVFWLRFWALATFILHISVMWVDYLQTGSASAPDSVLFPIYFCNLMMYVLLIVSFIKKSDSKLYNGVVTFTAFAGCFGAIISLFYPDYYFANPNLLSWGVLKSILSHSTMLIGCVYLFVGGFAKIRVVNTIYYFFGMLFCGALGLILNTVFGFFGIHRNAMYLQFPPIADVPFLNFFTIALLMIGIVFIFTIIYEQIAVKKGERWYNKIEKLFIGKKDKAN